jgi:hypothetical protein
VSLVKSSQVLRGICDTHACLGCQLFDGSLGLTDQIEKLKSLGACQRFSNTSELAVNVVLKSTLVMEHGAHAQVFN